MFRFNLQRITLLATVVFVSSFMLFPGSPLQSSNYSTVYAAAPIKCEAGVLCEGTNGDDNMKGTDSRDFIAGLDGDDRISGGDGNDDLAGGDGNDDLSGGKGSDELNGGLGADSFKCGPGEDEIDFFPAQGDTKSNDCEILL